MAAKLYYSSLPLNKDNSIRLLHITDTGDDYLRGVLQVVGLDSKPEFDALSYTRGQTTGATRSIRCESCYVTVSENCYSALLSLQRKVKPLVIWVDAVCINQQDKVEIDNHAPYAQRIYSAAQHVYLWLGNSDAKSDEVMAFLASGGLERFLYIDGDHSRGEVAKPLRAYRRLFFFPWVLTKTVDTHDKKPRTQKIGLRCKDGLRFGPFDALLRLLNTPWSTRIWTFQEAILATNPIVVCGQQHVPWVPFAMTILYIHHSKICTGELQRKLGDWVGLILSKDYFERRTHIDEEKGVAQGLLTRYGQHLRDLSKRHHRVRIPKGWLFFCFFVIGLTLCFIKRLRTYAAVWFPTITWLWMIFGLFTDNFSMGKGSERDPLTDSILLEYLLSAVFSRKATDTEDMYYGLQCVLRLLLNRSMRRTSDYQDTMRELTIAMLELTSSVTVLEYAAQGHTRIYSWAPTWGTVSAFGLLSASARTGKLNATHMAREVASNTPRLDLAHNTVTVKGVHLHSIVAVYAFQSIGEKYVPSEHDTHLYNARILRAIVLASQQKAKGAYRVGKDVRAHFPQLKKLKKSITPELLAFFDKIWLDATRPKSLTDKALRMYIQSLLSKENIAISDVLEGRIATDTSSWPPWSNSETESFRVHMTLCRLMSRYRCAFFHASIGLDYQGELWQRIDRTCYGICTDKAEIGDQVVLVEGIIVPLIMRTHNQQYQIVCPAHAFGMMQGQAWEYSLPGSDDDPPVYVQNRQHQIVIS